MQEGSQSVLQMVFNSWFIPPNVRVLPGILKLKLCHFGLLSAIQRNLLVPSNS